MRQSLVEIASALSSEPGERSKSALCYSIYENYFERFRDQPTALVEVGVFNGESTKVFSNYFANVRIVGIDNDLREIDLTGFDNVKLFQGDQSSNEFINALMDEHFPGGVDIVVDDASHIGSLSKRTFEILFPRLKSGGIYVIEDWGTGYWSDWTDGSVCETYDTRAFHQGEFPKRLLSHDFGMVGFLKQVVDLVGMSDNRPTFNAEQKVTSSIKGLHVFPGTAVVEKA